VLSFTGKSLPIHCVVEVSERREMTNSTTTTTSTADGKGETTSGKKIRKCHHHYYHHHLLIEILRNIRFPYLCPGLIDSPPLVEVDDFVIISAGTPFQEVVSTVLGLLGYPKETIQQAEGNNNIILAL